MKATSERKVSSMELDRELVATIQNVDSTEGEKEKAFAKIFKKYKDSVMYNLGKGVKFNSEITQDLMMEVFSKVHLSINAYNTEKAAVSTWISTITRNVLIDHIRSSKKHEAISLDSLNFVGGDDDNSMKIQVEDKSINSNGIDCLIKAERSKALLNAIYLLKNSMVQNVIFLFYFEGKSIKEIESQLNITESNVKVYLHRGKIKLKDLILTSDRNFNI